MKLRLIGDGPRKLTGYDEEARKSYTIIEIPVRKARQFIYKTYTPGHETITASSLPDWVNGFNGTSRNDSRPKAKPH